MQVMTSKERRILGKLTELANGDSSLVVEAMQKCSTPNWERGTNVVDAEKMIEYIEEHRDE